MRELKFRVWDKQCKKYIVGDLFFEQIDNSNFECDCYHDEDGEIHELKYSQRKLDRYHGYDIQQYTGLKDKNGKEIYEGDILSYEGLHKVSNGVSIVSFDDGSFMIDEDIASKDWAVEHEVVGNIFENPELLKQ